MLFSSLMILSRLADVADFLAHGLSPIWAVIAFFAVGYAIVGLPMHFRQGAASRDVWGTAGGVAMAAIYAAFLIAVYPALPHRDLPSPIPMPPVPAAHAH